MCALAVVTFQLPALFQPHREIFGHHQLSAEAQAGGAAGGGRGGAGGGVPGAADIAENVQLRGIAAVMAGEQGRGAEAWSAQFGGEHHALRPRRAEFLIAAHRIGPGDR